MCGFIGLVNFSQSYRNDMPKILQDMSEFIKHRGPDDYGHWICDTNNIALAHRRLSIIDTSNRGSQPMISPSKRYVIVFNGEIYNHLSLRKKCKQFTHWNSSSDTESLIVAIDILGIDEALKLSSGMFAFALWDRHEKNLILARDRAGEKPLYFSKLNKNDDSSIIFGSDLKAIRRYPSFNKTINPEAVSLFIELGYIPSSLSIYESVIKVKPATYLKFDLHGNQLDETNYWNPYEKIKSSDAGEKKSDSEYVEALDKILCRVVDDQMLSDVPLGAFLSGGIDSSLIVGVMQSISKNPVKSFSVGFHEKSFDESVYASAVAKHLGTDHSEIILSSSDAIASLDDITNSYDEPFADSSQIPTYLVSKLAKKDVSVSLSGDGGDELFGGYRRHISYNQYADIIFSTPLLLRKLSASIVSKSLMNNRFIESIAEKHLKISRFQQKLSKMLSILNTNNFEETYQNLISNKNISSNVSTHKFKDLSIKTKNSNNEPLKPLALEMMMKDFSGYMTDDVLVKVDRASMAVSLETRAPFLDRRIMNFALGLPFNQKIRKNESKWILRALLDKYVPRNLIDRPKVGFGIPLAKWLREDLRAYSSELLDKNDIKRHGFFNYDQIEIMWHEHLQGVDHSNELWPIIMFQKWMKSNHPEL